MVELRISNSFLPLNRSIALSQVDETKPLQEVLRDLGWTSWNDAAVGSCLRYLLKSQWRIVVPTDWDNFVGLALEKFPLGQFRPPQAPPDPKTP